MDSVPALRLDDRWIGIIGELYPILLGTTDQFPLLLSVVGPSIPFAFVGRVCEKGLDCTWPPCAALWSWNALSIKSRGNRRITEAFIEQVSGLADINCLFFNDFCLSSLLISTVTIFVRPGIYMNLS